VLARVGGGIAGVVLDWPCRPLRCLVWTRLKRLARVAPESLAVWLFWPGLET